MKTAQNKRHCTNCGNLFSGRGESPYCSKKCYSAHRGRLKVPRHEIKEKQCPVCGETFMPNRMHPNQDKCSLKCRRKADYERQKQHRKEQPDTAYTQAVAKCSPLSECPFATGLIRDVWIYGPANYHPGEAYAAL